MRRTEVPPDRQPASDLRFADAGAVQLPYVVGASPAVIGRPNRLPFGRAWANPARTRSRTMPLSNSAKTASSPAIARPAGVVRSRASVRETKPTPSVATGSLGPVGNGPARHPTGTGTSQHDIDLPAARCLHQWIISGF